MSPLSSANTCRLYRVRRPPLIHRKRSERKRVERTDKRTVRASCPPCKRRDLSLFFCKYYNTPVILADRHRREYYPCQYKLIHAVPFCRSFHLLSGCFYNSSIFPDVINNSQYSSFICSTSSSVIFKNSFPDRKEGHTV